MTSDREASYAECGAPVPPFGVHDQCCKAQGHHGEHAHFRALGYPDAFTAFMDQKLKWKAEHAHA